MVKEGKLTKRQKDILEYIKKFSAQKKYPPSIREIAANFNLSSPATAHVHVKKLIEKGYLKRGKGSNHLLELQVPNEFEYKNDEVVTVPLLGKVTAGNPIEAIEVPNEVISLPTYLMTKKKEVTYDDIVSVIQGADSRIKSVIMDEPDYTVNLITGNGTVKKLADASSSKIRNN